MDAVELIRFCEVDPRVELIDSAVPFIGLAWEVLEETHALVTLSRQQNRELSWVGKVKEIPLPGRTLYWIEEIRVLRQSSSIAWTAIDPVALGEIACEWIEQCGGKDNPLRFWGHVHPVGIGVDPSRQDEDQMSSLMRSDLTMPFFIRGIFGSSGKAFGNQGTMAAETDFSFKADFTLYDYRRGIQVKSAPWGMVSRRNAAQYKIELGEPKSVVATKSPPWKSPTLINVFHGGVAAKSKSSRKKGSVDGRKN